MDAAAGGGCAPSGGAPPPTPAAAVPPAAFAYKSTGEQQQQQQQRAAAAAVAATAGAGYVSGGAEEEEEEAHVQLLRRVEGCLQHPLGWVAHAAAAGAAATTGVAAAGGGAPPPTTTTTTTTTTGTSRGDDLASLGPRVLTGLRWPAHRLWTVGYIQRRVDPTGRALVNVNRSRSERFPDFSFAAADEAEANPVARLPFSSFVDHLLARPPPTDEWLYLSGDAAHLRHCGQEGGLFAPLLQDLHVPPQIDSRRLVTIGFWMGRKGTVAHMHFDRNGCHNINAQVRGRKLFILFPPAEFAKLYPPTSSHAQRGDTGGRRGLGLLRNMSQIDLRTIHEPQQRARFPDFAGARGLKVVLHEGEMLIIPACWYHFVMSLDDLNINVNFWWKPGTDDALPGGFPSCEEEEEEDNGGSERAEPDTQPTTKPSTPRPSRRH